MEEPSRTLPSLQTDPLDNTVSENTTPDSWWLEDSKTALFGTKQFRDHCVGELEFRSLTVHFAYDYFACASKAPKRSEGGPDLDHVAVDTVSLEYFFMISRGAW